MRGAAEYIVEYSTSGFCPSHEHVQPLSVNAEHRQAFTMGRARTHRFCLWLLLLEWLRLGIIRSPFLALFLLLCFLLFLLLMAFLVLSVFRACRPATGRLRPPYTLLHSHWCIESTGHVPSISSYKPPRFGLGAKQPQTPMLCDSVQRVNHIPSATSSGSCDHRSYCGTRFSTPECPLLRLYATPPHK